MDVIVIGCGASGVAALRKLHDAGLKVIGLEAADRIGGRIRTVEFGDNVVDIGAAWCHGEESNVVFELANPLGLLGRPKPDENWYVSSTGSLVSDSSAKNVLEALSSAVDEEEKDCKGSIAQCLRNAAKTKETLKSSQLTSSCVEWYERSNHLGGQDDPKQGKSLRGLSEFWPCAGEFMFNWKGRGYKTILDVLLNKYPDPSKQIPVEIHLNKEVENIRWAASQGTTGNPLVQVKCKDGSLYAAKSVIVTVSIGVLKERHTDLFNPPLPAQKVNTINNLQLCVLDKIYVEFTEPWWPSAPAHFTILWREEDKVNYPENERWITEIYSVNTVEYQPNVLLIWLYGNGARMMERASQEDVEAGVDKFLELFRKNFDVTPVKSVVRSQWASNPLVRGAYSYRSVYTEEKGGSAIELSEPLYHESDFPVVCFAGEATSHHRHNSVHGAVEAGFREAERLIESFKKLNI